MKPFSLRISQLLGLPVSAGQEWPAHGSVNVKVYQLRNQVLQIAHFVVLTHVRRPNITPSARRGVEWVDYHGDPMALVVHMYERSEVGCV